MWKNIITKFKVKRAMVNTRKTLIRRLCDYRKPFYSNDLHTIYSLLKKHEAEIITSPVIDGKCVEVTIDENKFDWFSFKVKYSVPTMDITLKISVRAGAPQVGSDESDTIYLNIESIFDSNKRISRKIIERSFEFINAIDYKNLYTDIRTPKVEGNITMIKKVLANAFEIIIDYIIDWRTLS